MKLSKTLLLLSIFGTATIAFYTHAQISTGVWERYWDTANQLNKDIDSASFEDLKKLSAELTGLATQILPDFVVKQPICKEYITAAMDAAETMQKSSLEEIEWDYHADGKLPAIKDASCYHAKDLLVHPATISVIVRTLPDTKKHREMLHHELEEVLEHFKQVKAVADK